MRPPAGVHPVVLLPPDCPILDLRGSAWPAPLLWSIGRYGENRGIYTQDLFQGPRPRTVHLGIDLGAPAGTAVHAFSAGEVLFAGINPAPGDYGATLVLAHSVAPHLAPSGQIWALYGHLSKASLQHARRGRRFEQGEVIAWLGTPAENGGWPPHLHFQLSRSRPDRCDLPGACHPDDFEAASQQFPDPALVLGPLPAAGATHGL